MSKADAIAVEAWGEVVTSPASRREYAETCAAFLAPRLGLHVEDILGRTQRPEPAHARMLIMLKMHRMGWGLIEIGEAVARDHSTAWHGITRAEALIRTDAELAAAFIGIPTWGERVITESSLTEKYDRLTSLLAEACVLRDQIQEELDHQSVPRRVVA